MSGPLSGIKVLELGAIGPAPFAGAFLADLGADVVRIDRLPVAGVPPSLSPRYDFYNRNKRSVALDLKQPAAVSAVLQLATNADVLIEGFRPGVTERLGVGPVACQALNPRLVYARMTGWGQDGPLAREVGHDINYLALTGALHCIGSAEAPPVPPLNLVADMGGGGLYLMVGVLAAIIESRGSGFGQVVDVAMIDGVTHMMSAFQAFTQLGSWSVERGANTVDGGAPYYGTYETLDGRYVAIGSMEPPFYAALLEVLGLTGVDLPHQEDRAAWPALRARFAAIFRTRTRDQWEHAMQGHDVCFSPVLSIDEAPLHPQMRARSVHTKFAEALHPSPAPRFGRTPGSLRRPAPAPGEHSEEVLTEWGVSAAAIAELAASGAMKQIVPR